MSMIEIDKKITIFQKKQKKIIREKSIFTAVPCFEAVQIKMCIIETNNYYRNIYGEDAGIIIDYTINKKEGKTNGKDKNDFIPIIIQRLVEKLPRNSGKTAKTRNRRTNRTNKKPQRAEQNVI